MIFVNCGCGEKYSTDSEWVNIDFNSNSKNVKKVNILKGLPFANNSVDAVFSSCMLEHFTKDQGEEHIAECYRVLKPGGILRIVVPDLENVCKEYLEVLEKVKSDQRYEKKYDYILIELIDQMTRTHGGGEMLKYWEDKAADIEYVKCRTGFPEDYKVSNDSVKHRIFIRLMELKRKLSSKIRLLNVIDSGRWALHGELHKWMYDSYNLSALLEKNGFTDICLMVCNDSHIPSWKKYKLEITEEGTEYKPNCLYMEASRL